MSWIPSSSSRSLPSPSVEREAAAKAGSTPDRDVPSLTRGVSKELEGDVRVRMMTSTYHKLRKALKKGMREMQWQRKIQEIESCGLYPAQTRRCGVLRESADMNGNAAAKLKKESFSLKRRKGTKLATVASAQAKLELEEGKGNMVHNEIMSYPSSAGSGKIRDIKKMARNILKRTKTD
ncbi:hypothetical protein GBAR_LOCUS18570 [Geodia barretti]|uniref:Uncharacterized protein n=1 Tax=Geodia barretti TaxID=519541 RepID=A0AA35WU60_GEOBA|nr:hypothetical protein GBAR_LOCUS18570 [Geodia barretti]